MSLSLATRALLIFVSSLGACTSGCKECDYVPAIGGEIVTFTVQDAQGNMVPLEGGSLQLASDSKVCEISTYDGKGECSQAAPGGTSTLTVQAQGQTLTRELTTSWTRKDDQGCKYPNRQEVVLELGGPGCPVPSVPAIQGQFIDADGKGTTGSAQVVFMHRTVACTVQGSSFSCPALSAYESQYVLSGAIGTSQFSKNVNVTAPGCVINTANVPFDLSQLICQAEPGPAVNGLIATKPGSQVNVSLQKQGGRSESCTVEAPHTEGDTAFYEYACASFERPGGGEFTLLVSDGKYSRSYPLSLLDNGCSAITERRDIRDLAEPPPA